MNCHYHAKGSFSQVFLDSRWEISSWFASSIKAKSSKKNLRCVCPSIQSTLTEWEWSTTASERIICCVLFWCSASAQLLSSLHPRQSSGTHPQLTASFSKSSIWGLWTTWEARGGNVKAALCSVSVRRCSLCCVSSVSSYHTLIASGALCVVPHAPAHGACFSVSDFKKRFLVVTDLSCKKQRLNPWIYVFVKWEFAVQDHCEAYVVGENNSFLLRQQTQILWTAHFNHYNQASCTGSSQSSLEKPVGFGIFNTAVWHQYCVRQEPPLSSYLTGFVTDWTNHQS